MYVFMYLFLCSEAPLQISAACGSAKGSVHSLCGRNSFNALALAGDASRCFVLALLYPAYCESFSSETCIASEGLPLLDIFKKI